MWIVNKIILVFSFFLINTLSAYGENFELICEINKSALLVDKFSHSNPKRKTDFDEKYLFTQNHFIINNEAFFEQRNISTKQIINYKNKISWTYIDDNSFRYRELNYLYFDNTKKLNIEIGRKGDIWTAWGTCKKEPIDKATLAKYFKAKPSGYNSTLSEYNKVLENKLKEVERKSKELENKLAALQTEKKLINKSLVENKDIGSGFYVSKFRHVITNQHVVNQCKKITIGDSITNQIPADLIAADKKNDLAVLQTVSMDMASADTKSFVQKLAIQIVPVLSGGLMRSEDVTGGEQIYVAGFPLGNMVSDQMKLDDGIVSATKGMDNDVSQFIVSSDIKKGNSGGPVYDNKGNIVGVAVSRLNVNRTDTINFAIKGSTVKQFLSAHNVPTKWSNRQDKIDTKDLYQIASKQTVMVVCHR